MGERGLLVEVAALDDVLDLHARLDAARPAGVVELVPAARTILVVVDPRVLSLSAARTWLRGEAGAALPGPGGDHPGGDHPGGDHPAGDHPGGEPAGRPIVLDIRYDGPDLDSTAALLGLTPDALAARHAAAEWTVAFTGFAPGFGYLVSPDWTFDVPRLDAPRTRVPPGAVGLAAGFTGAYPRATPGGWRLIGTTTTRLFDAEALRPALLAPGARVRFRELPRAGSSAAADSRLRRWAGSDAPGTADRRNSGDGGAVQVLSPGLLATVQDQGRPGHAAEGVARSGGLDRSALRTANRLLGNPEGAAGIEVTMGGFRALAARDLWFAVAGAWGPILLDGRPVDPYAPHRWPAATELHLDWFAHGARAYLAVRGGVDGPVVAGSRSSDLLAGLGRPRLGEGDCLAVGGPPAMPIPATDVAPWGAPHDDALEVDLAPGPRADWFAPDARRALFESVWVVTNDADRVGMRLDGPELVRVRADELPSEGMVPGSLQVPPSGRPTILLADGPVTGGYPVIAVVTDAALDTLAQARPGSRIRFRHARPPA